jgi:formylglycine-generating enzyme required for sulfatase activity
MKKLLLFIVMLGLSLILVACGPPEQAGGGEESSGSTQPANTSTPVVLATPTPKPAPPTPTPRPSPTPAPLESAPEEGGEEATSEAEATEEVAAAPISEDMVLIPAGPFTMGQNGSKPKNGPANEVDLPAYEIDRFEVTNDEFARFVQEAGYTTYAEGNSSKNWTDAATDKGNHPVVYVTWDDATAYCEWAGKRLSTEAEWEKAARGEDGRTFPWGNDFPGDDAVAEFGNFYETGLRSTFPAGAFEKGASPYGVYDMAGNVREWVQDFFVAYPGAAADADPFFGEENRVNRGGGWFDGQDGELVTTYNRNAGPPETSANDDIGFRCARDAQ